jgi:predicted transcriptional regulator
MTVREIKEALNATVVHMSVPEDSEILCACATDLMSEVLYYTRNNSVLITGLTKPQAIRTAHIADIKVVVFTRGKEPDAQTMELSKEKGITLLITPYSMFTACGILHGKGLRCCPE